jgi:hypothetical protein
MFCEMMSVGTIQHHPLALLPVLCADLARHFDCRLGFSRFPGEEVCSCRIVVLGQLLA